MTPATHRTIDHVAEIVLDSVTLDSTISAALNQLDQCAGGYPATTPGASTAGPQPVTECHHPECTNTLPCEEHEPAIQLTSPERLAGQRDKALADEKQLKRLVKRIRRDIATAATISQRWGTSGIDGNTVRQRLNDALSTTWCLNCAEHGFNRKRTHGDYCEFCSGIKSKYKRYPNQQLCAMNDVGRRVMPSDVIRAFKADKAKEAQAVVEDVEKVDSLDEARQRRARRSQNVS